jgi:predicted NBD/HSP70 family sugar kinase
MRDILATIYSLSRATRAEIAAQTKLNNASVSRALQHLVSVGLVRKLGEMDSGGGRPREVLSLNEDAAAFLAIDLEGVTVRFARTNLAGAIISRWEEVIPISAVFPVQKLYHGIDLILRDLTPSERDRVLAIGVSYPGLLDEHGLLTAVNLGWREIPLGQLLADRYALPAFFERDEGTCIRAERSHGQARDSRNWIYLLASHGIGVGLVVDGHHISGQTNMAGELGHVVIDPSSSVLCRCGKSGCLETVASTPAIVQRYAELVGRRARSLIDTSLDEIFARARRGDSAALAVIDRAGRAIGLALSHAVNLLNPELIVLGGDIASGEDLLTPRVREELNRHALPQLAETVRILSSNFGPDIRLRGAASLAFHRCVSNPKLLAKLCATAALG